MLHLRLSLSFGLCALLLLPACKDGGSSDTSTTETEGGTDATDSDPTTTPGDGDGDDPTDPGDGDGDPTDPGDGDGDPTDPGDGDGDPADSGDGDGDMDTGDEGFKFDVGEIADSPDIMDELPPYLLHINGDKELLLISIETAEVEFLCDLIDVDTDAAPEGGFASLTFNREDRLLASTGGWLWEIFLPSCDAMRVGQYGNGNGGIFGITPATQGNGLMGISSISDNLVTIDENTGESTTVGPLGIDWFTHGATWVDESEILYGIRSTDNGLYDVNTDTGQSVLVSLLDVQFSNVGMEYHPKTGLIYACTNDGNLYVLDEDASSSIVGETGLPSCTNLGAPFGDPVLPEG